MSITLFPGNLKETVYPSVGGALNITEQDLLSYPTANNGVPGVSCTASSWTEVIPVSTITTRIYIYRVVAKESTSTDMKIAKGGGGSEVEIGHLYSSYDNTASGGAAVVGNVFDFPIPIEVEANARIALDITGDMRIVYAIPSLINSRCNSKNSYIDYIGSGSSASGTSANSFGSWGQLIASTSKRFVLSSVTIQAYWTVPSTTSYLQKAMLEIGIGAAASEVTIIKVPLGWRLYNATGGSLAMACRHTFPFPIHRLINSGVRIAVRMADDSTTAFTYAAYLNGYGYPL